MHNGMMMGGPAMMAIGFAVMVLVLVALAAGVAWVVRTVTRDGHSDQPSSAMEWLEVRYARGDLDREEYLQRRDDLAVDQPR